MGVISLPFFLKNTNMQENQNPFFVLQQELKEQRILIEKLINNQQSTTTDDLDKYEQGVHVAMEETGAKRQLIYQRIKDIPHRKKFGKLYFSRSELRRWIATEEGKI